MVIVVNLNHSLAWLILNYGMAFYFLRGRRDEVKGKEGNVILFCQLVYVFIIIQQLNRTNMQAGKRMLLGLPYVKVSIYFERPCVFLASSIISVAS